MKNYNITRIVSPIYGSDKTPAGCIEVFQDHSVFKELLERVRHDDRRLKIILDNLDIGVPYRRSWRAYHLFQQPG